MWHAGDGMGWWMVWGGLMMFLFWGAIIALIVWVIQTVARQGSTQTLASHADPSSPTALDITKERYARGEVNREEFEQIKRDLGEV